VNAKMTFAGLINALFRPAHPTPPKLGTPPFVGMINDRFGSCVDDARATPCTWNTFLARSTPMVLTCMWTTPLR
jgi:hypothetical protein